MTTIKPQLGVAYILTRKYPLPGYILGVLTHSKQLLLMIFCDTAGIESLR